MRLSVWNVTLLAALFLAACGSTPNEPLKLVTEPAILSETPPRPVLRENAYNEPCAIARLDYADQKRLQCVTVKYVTNHTPRQDGDSISFEPQIDRPAPPLSYGEVEVLVYKRESAIADSLKYGPMASPDEQMVEDGAVPIMDLTTEDRMRGSDTGEHFRMRTLSTGAEHRSNPAARACEEQAFFGTAPSAGETPASSIEERCNAVSMTSIIDAAQANNNSVLVFIPDMGAGFTQVVATIAQTSADIAYLRDLRNEYDSDKLASWTADCGHKDCFDIGQPVVFAWRNSNDIFFDFDSRRSHYHVNKRLIEETDSSATELADFLIRLADSMGADPETGQPARINILAHGMGNRLLIQEWNRVAFHLVEMENAGLMPPRLSIIHAAAELTLEEHLTAANTLEAALAHASDPDLVRRIVYSSNDDITMVMAKLNDGEWQSVVTAVSEIWGLKKFRSSLKALNKTKQIFRGEPVDGKGFVRKYLTVAEYSTESIAVLDLLCLNQEIVDELPRGGVRKQLNKLTPDERTMICSSIDMAGLAADAPQGNIDLIDILEMIPGVYPKCRLGEITESHCVNRNFNLGAFNKNDDNKPLIYDTERDEFRTVEVINVGGRAMFDPGLLIEPEKIDDGFIRSIRRRAIRSNEYLEARKNKFADHDAALRKPLVLTDLACFLDGVPPENRPLVKSGHDTSQRTGHGFHTIRETSTVNRCNPTDVILYYDVASSDLVWPYASPDPDRQITLSDAAETYAPLKRLRDILLQPTDDGEAFICQQAWLAVTGSASQEGPSARNEERARLRTDLAARYVASLAEQAAQEHGCPAPLIFKINLGQAPCPQKDCPASPENANVPQSEEQRLARLYTRGKISTEPLSMAEAERDIKRFVKEFSVNLKSSGFTDTSKICNNIELWDSTRGEDKRWFNFTPCK